jgi:hypothetical protein
MEHCGLPCDAIVDEESAPYPPADGFDLQELTTEGYSALLRMERGRVRRREIFGPPRRPAADWKCARPSSCLVRSS